MISNDVTAKLIPGVILKPKPRLLIFYIDISFTYWYPPGKPIPAPIPSASN